MWGGKLFVIIFDDGFCNVFDYVLFVFDEFGFIVICYFVLGKFG